MNKGIQFTNEIKQDGVAHTWKAQFSQSPHVKAV